MTAPISVRAATRADAPALHALLVALAEHEGQRDWLRVSLEALTRDGFGDNPRFGAMMAFAGDTRSATPRTPCPTSSGSARRP